MVPKMNVDQIIKHLNLSPHIEGGYGGIFYQDQGIIPVENLPSCYESNRTYGNAIYFLLPKDTKSIIHRIKMNEVWHFYLGNPLKLFIFSPDGHVKEVVLGNNLLDGNQLTYVVPKMHWVGALPMGPDFSLVGCFTSPGFEKEDWEKGERDKLINDYPHAKDIISVLT